jgi:hypothetical protein
VDHQIVAMEMESGVSVSLNFVGHSHREGRTLRLDGARATLRGAFLRGDYRMSIHDHLTNEVEELALPPANDDHGGGDTGLMRAFLAALRSGRVETLTSARNAMESHLMAFAAEEARVKGTVVQMDDYRRRVEAFSPASVVAPATHI